MTRTILLLFTALGIAAAQQTGASGDRGNAANGKVLFRKAGCYECHGYAGQGSRAGAQIAATPLEAQDLIRYVRRPSGEMPAYTEKTISDRDLKDIYAYIESLPEAKKADEIPLLKKIKERRQ